MSERTDYREWAFTADRVLKLTGLTRRQLQYWEDTDLIRPTMSRPDARGRGRPRLYAFRDLVELSTAARLRRSVPLQVIRRVRDHLRTLDYETPLSEIRFEVVDGDLAFFEGGTVRRGRQPEQIVIAVTLPLGAIVDELVGQIQALDERPVGQLGRRRGALGGKILIAGTRIPVATVQRLARSGLGEAQIRELYPDLTSQDVAAAVAAGSSPRQPARAAS